MIDLARLAPGWGLGWQLWRRHRWGFAADAAWLALLALVANLLPAVWRRPEVGQNLAHAAAAVFIHLLAVFTYGFEIDMSAKQSGFPPRMFTLPLSTRRLVAWPVSLGLLATTAAWLTVALGILRPCGVDAPLALPAAATAAALLAIQAVSWTPFEFGWARVLVTVALLLALLAPLLISLLGVSAAPLEFVYLALLPCLYGGAVAGVSRARRGDAYQWRWCQAAVRLVSAMAPERRAPFASAAQAQLWFECRRHAGQLPFFLLILLIPIGLISILDVRELHAPAHGLRVVGIVLGVPAFLAGILSAGLGKHDFSAKTFGMPAFLATRPISAGGFVAAKFKMAAVSALVAWLLTLLFPAIWLLAPGNAAYVKQVFAAAAVSFGPAKLAAIVALAAVGLPALIWRKLVDGMWATMTGRAWIATVCGILLGLLVVGVAIPLGLTLQFFPEYRPLAWRLVPWLIAAAVAAKSIAAVILLRKLWRSQFVARPAFGPCLALWCATTAALAAALFALAPAGASVWMPLASAVLVVPLNRLAAAPLALNWNRHR